MQLNTKRFNIYHVSLIFMAITLSPLKIIAQTIIPIETKSNALVLRVDEKKNLNTIYFGKKLSNAAEYEQIPQVYKQTWDYTGVLSSPYTPSGSKSLLEPAISVSHADGNNSLDLRYVSHNLTKIDSDVSLTTLVLKDQVYDFQVMLYYKTYFKDDVVELWTVIKHKEKGNVLLHKFASANLYLKAKGYWLKQYHGNWGKEMRPEETKITHGIKTLDSKLGTRPNLFQPSVFMVSLDKPATEDEGSVLYGALAYSGNFRTDLEVDYLDNLKIISGINNYASSYTLKPNEEFTTPEFLYTFSSTGKGNASRNMHNWARNYKIPDGKGQRLTLLNNWEATEFNFNESKLFELLKDTRKLGVDLFLLDDGWFANKYPRNGDGAGLGDWEANKTKLPNGIASLVKEAQNNGVKFGIWIEPEMVNPKSNLYEKHPDWVIKQPKREEHYFRNQLVLDMSNPKVQDFVFDVVNDLFTHNPGLAYIKWDCNSVIYNAYSATLGNQNHFYIEYMRGLYKVLERIRARYPTVPMMLCAGGGGRVDYSILKYFTEFWPSDNTEPVERIFIQWENSYFYPSITSSNHVTAWGKQPIKFRTDVAMMGKLGFDIVIKNLKDDELKYVQDAVVTYNNIKPIIWYGDQYRLANPDVESVASMLYVNAEKTVGIMFNYLVNNRFDEGSKFPIRLKGLDAAKTYRIKELNLYPGTNSAIDTTKNYTGEFLMTVGFNPDTGLSRTSVILQIEIAN